MELIALILLPLGMFMTCYALYVFTWRSAGIGKKRATQFDDRYGPLALCAAVVVALVGILVITSIDFYEEVHGGGAAGGPPPPPPLDGAADAAWSAARGVAAAALRAGGGGASSLAAGASAL